MNRRKDSISPSRFSKRTRCNKAKGKLDHDETESRELCPYFANIPSHLTMQILLQLPIKSLFICKCVCKMWKTLISEPHFAKLHFEKTPVSLMIRTNDCGLVSRTLYLLECDPEKFEIGSDNHVKLEPFKLPLRSDVKSFGEKPNTIEKKSEYHLRSKNFVLDKYGAISNRGSPSLYIAKNPYFDKFNIVNSCNGLLCLTDIIIENHLVICNPVTGEFVRLPEATTHPLNTTQVKKLRQQNALGFLPKTNEYKVIKILIRYAEHADDLVIERVIPEINTLGTPSWRNVEVDSQVSILCLKYPTCVNGALHWIEFEDRPRSIVCFCLESERFQPFPSPPHVFGNHNNSTCGNSNIIMGELKGFIYICDSTFFSNVTMWVMNEYGNGESWTKLYNIDTLDSFLGSPDLSCYPDLSHYGLCLPIKHFEEGAAVLLYHSRNRFIYYEPEKYGFKVFQIHGSWSDFVEIIPHIPSLISLKDVVKGDNIEVLNIHSRCAKLKLREENEALSLSQLIDGDLGSNYGVIYISSSSSDEEHYS